VVGPALCFFLTMLARIQALTEIAGSQALDSGVLARIFALAPTRVTSGVCERHSLAKPDNDDYKALRMLCNLFPTNNMA